MDEFIKTVMGMRDSEVNYQKKCKNSDVYDKETFLYLEGRISAMSDVIIQYYYHFKEEETKNV